MLTVVSRGRNLECEDIMGFLVCKQYAASLSQSG
jgi:hypothetical protein